MPDFTARVTAGSSQETWTDTPTLTKPSRLNPVAAYPHTYRKVTKGSVVTVKATVAGVEGPLDAALGGRLFVSSFGEVPPGGGSATITTPAGQSSVASFTLDRLGHWLFTMRRPDGGAVAVPLYVHELI